MAYLRSSGPGSGRELHFARMFREPHFPRDSVRDAAHVILNNMKMESMGKNYVEKYK